MNGRKVLNFYTVSTKHPRVWHYCQKFRQINNFVLPFNNASWVISTSPPVLYLEDPWLFFCFFFKDLLAKGSIRSTTVPNVDIFDGKLSLWFHVKNSSCFFFSNQHKNHFFLTFRSRCFTFNKLGVHSCKCTLCIFMD